MPWKVPNTDTNVCNLKKGVLCFFFSAKPLCEPVGQAGVPASLWLWAGDDLGGEPCLARHVHTKELQGHTRSVTPRSHEAWWTVIKLVVLNLYQKTLKIYYYQISFFNGEMMQVLEIFPCWRQFTTKQCKEAGYLQTWYWPSSPCKRHFQRYFLERKLLDFDQNWLKFHWSLFLNLKGSFDNNLTVIINIWQ